MGEISIIKNGDREKKKIPRVTFSVAKEDDEIKEIGPTTILPSSQPQSILHKFLRTKKSKCPASPTGIFWFRRMKIIPSWMRKLFQTRKKTQEFAK